MKLVEPIIMQAFDMYQNASRLLDYLGMHGARTRLTSGMSNITYKYVYARMYARSHRTAPVRHPTATNDAVTWRRENEEQNGG